VRKGYARQGVLLAVGLVFVADGTGFRAQASNFTPRASGDQLWTTPYDNGGNDDLTYGVAVSPDGARAFVTGYSVPTQSDDYRLHLHAS
jgi:hypothetical protein